MLRSKSRIAPKPPSRTGQDHPNDEIQHEVGVSRAISGTARWLLGRLAAVRGPDCCGSGSADMLCVMGAITAMTGCLIAISGILPKNQARIRLYLECFGCSMVIVGVLIVFLSQRIRHPPPSGNVSLQTAVNELAAALSHHHEGRHWRLGPLVELSPAPTSSSLEDEEPTCSHVLPSEQLKVEQQEPLPSLEVANEVVMTELGSLWIPDESSIASLDHQAAVEAALSNCLPVATLVGWRPELPQAEDSGAKPKSAKGAHCCPHHAVQHRDEARKWLAKLKMLATLGRASDLDSLS